MTIQLEAGKFYRTRDGRKVGPLRRNGDGKSFNNYWPLTAYMSDRQEFWRGPGKADDQGLSYSHEYGNRGDGADIVAEWTEGPVRTVTTTRTEIVRGQYGKVVVEYAQNGGGLRVYTNLFEDPSAEELRAAAATLTAIADALDAPSP